jgi:hypothetical protein
MGAEIPVKHRLSLSVSTALLSQLRSAPACRRNSLVVPGDTMSCEQCSQDAQDTQDTQDREPLPTTHARGARPTSGRSPRRPPANRRDATPLPERSPARRAASHSWRRSVRRPATHQLPPSHRHRCRTPAPSAAEILHPGPSRHDLPRRGSSPSGADRRAGRSPPPSAGSSRTAGGRGCTKASHCPPASATPPRPAGAAA